MGEYQWWSSLQNLHMYNIKNCGLPRWHQWQKTCLLKQETRDVSSVLLGQEDLLEEGIATHSSILCLENPVDRGVSWAMGPQGHRVRHN